MAFRKVKDLAVVTGTYQSNGETKKRYANVGAVMEGDDGSRFITLDRHFNPAGVPFKEGGDRIVISMFDPRDSNGGQQTQQRQQSSGYQQRELDDDVPF